MVGMSRTFASILLALAFLAMAYAALKPHGIARTSGPLPSGCYIWQRVWDAPVKEAVRGAPVSLDRLALLCAEISWTAKGKASTVCPRWDGAALRESGRRISAVLRVGARVPSEEADAEICETARAVVRRLRAERIEPAELQIDFDCAESQLPAYRTSLAALRTALAPLPVQPTVLPSWLGHREFRALAAESGGYVLQVHATRRPRLNAAETALCEAADARRWVEAAGRLGVPFRVALPTYTYRVAFAPDGTLLDIEGEGASRKWPEGTILRTFRPDAGQLADLVRAWTNDRPANLKGLLWYRLPVPSDAWNWRWPTLAAVMQGRPPRMEVRVEPSAGSPTDLTLVNRGEGEAALPSRIVAASRSAVQAADGVGGYHAEIRGSSAIFQRDDVLASARIPPGERRALGWVRAEGLSPTFQIFP